MPIRFTPIKFPLKMRGVDIRNLDDLRKNFDLNAAVEYFKDGRLLKWLKIRYYDDEAEEIAILDDTAPNFRQKLCAALGVDFTENFSTRPVEKRNISHDTIDEKFERNAEEKVYRPTAPTQSTASDELRDIAEVIFGKRKVWNIVDSYGEPTSAQKKMFIKMICGGEYSERDLVYLCADKDFAAGWALTRDAFCVGGALKFQCYDMQADDVEFQAELDEKLSQAKRRGRKKILYKEIVSAEIARGNFAQPQGNNFFNDILGFGGMENNSFIQTSSIGGMMIVDRDEIWWSVTRDDFTLDDSFSIIVNGGPIYGNAPETDKFAVLNDKIEAQIVKFLNFARDGKSVRVENPTARRPAEKVSGIDGGLRETFGIFFGTHDVWNIVGMYGKPPTAQKKMLIKMICGDAYTERDLIHLRATSDFSAGWALTKDAFCVGGRLTLNSAGRERKKFFYREIATVDNDWGFFYVVDRENYSWNLDKYHDATILNDAIKKQLANFLNQAKG